MPSTSQPRQAEKNPANTQQKAGDLSAWPLEQDPSESGNAEPQEQQEYDYSCEEQMVPPSIAYQSYRYAVKHERQDKNQWVYKMNKTILAILAQW